MWKAGGGRLGIFNFGFWIGRGAEGPYFVPHARDFEGRPQRAGRLQRAGTLTWGGGGSCMALSFG